MKRKLLSCSSSSDINAPYQFIFSTSSSNLSVLSAHNFGDLVELIISLPDDDACDGAEVTSCVVIDERLIIGTSQGRIYSSPLSHSSEEETLTITASLLYKPPREFSGVGVV